MTVHPLVTHAVRLQHWAPICARRAEEVKVQRGGSASFRYFSLSHNDPIDVLHLYPAVIKARRQPGTNAIVLGDVHICSEAVDPQPLEASLPGAQSFGNAFVEAMTHNMAEEIDAPSDTEAYNQFYGARATRKRFLQYVPFDAVSLAWSDSLIGHCQAGAKALSAISMFFAAQRDAALSGIEISAWSLQVSWICPASMTIGGAASTMLAQAIDANVDQFPELADMLSARWGASSAAALAAADLADFLSLAMPKVILSMLENAGWVPEVSRDPVLIKASSGNETNWYYMLDVVRADGSAPPSATYAGAARSLFELPPAQAPLADAAVALSHSDAEQQAAQFRGGSAYL